MSDSADNNSIAFALGKIEGQLREVIHKQNNMEQRLDDLVERGFKAATADDIDRLAKRIDELESTNDRNDGAKGVLAAIMHHASPYGPLPLLRWSLPRSRGIC